MNIFWKKTWKIVHGINLALEIFPNPRRHCKNCDMDGDTNEKCCKLHLQLCPKRYKSMKRENSVVNIPKEMVLDSTFDLDENIVCITLQEPSVSGDINSLF